MCVDLSLLSFSFPALPRIHCIFPLRSFYAIQSTNPFAGNLSYTVHDTADDVTKRRAYILDSCKDLGLEEIFDGAQVHGKHVLFEPREEDRSTEADGLATSKPHQGLFIKTADCQSILIAEKSERSVLALHVGWRGNRSNFIHEAIEQFCTTYSVSPKDLFAVRGPSLSPQRAEFVHFASEWPENFLPFFSRETQTMDLWALTRFQLQQCGVPENHIFGIDLCTISNPSCFSYRSERNAGRLGGIIWIGSPFPQPENGTVRQP